jgi:hypothetical protein
MPYTISSQIGQNIKTEAVPAYTTDYSWIYNEQCCCKFLAIDKIVSHDMARWRAFEHISADISSRNINLKNGKEPPFSEEQTYS